MPGFRVTAGGEQLISPENRTICSDANHCTVSALAGFRPALRIVASGKEWSRDQSESFLGEHYPRKGSLLLNKLAALGPEILVAADPVVRRSVTQLQ
jgi:hypothetical protein